MFRFHFWEPIWYFEPTKAPQDNWKMGRWLGFADSVGDLMTYWIETEGDGKPQILARSGVRTRRNIEGMESLQDVIDVNKNLPPTPLNLPIPSCKEPLVWSNISNELDADPVSEEDLENNIDEDGNDDFVFQNILGHEIKNGILYFKAQYNNACGIQTWTVPFKWLKKDVPLDVSHYIKNHVVEAKRRGAYSGWANKIIQTNSSQINRVLKSHGADTSLVSNIRRLSRNGYKMRKTNEIKFGFRLPTSFKDALAIDKECKDTLWMDVEIPIKDNP